jgi:hypothetical protein
MRILAGLALLAAAWAVPAQMMTMQPSYQGLWWKVPAGSESGWGVNISHQGSILFATWFTYDADGSGMWLVMPDGQLQSTPGYMMGYGYGYGGEPMMSFTYSGTLYRTTGPSFDSASFDPAAVHATAVGTATFDFMDPNLGTFTYSVNGVTGSKTITRQVFSTVPDCELGGAAASPPNYQDLWWRSSESGWGVNVTHQGDVIFATWFTYGSDGKGLWLVMPNGAKVGDGVYSGALYRTTGPAFNTPSWNPMQVGVTQVGTGTFTFTDANNATFAYTVNGVSQSKGITRQVFAQPTSICR